MTTRNGEAGVLDRCGLAAISETESSVGRQLLASLEWDQAAFLAHEGRFRSPGYAWYRDALHNWSRVWEYPYVYYHVRRWLTHRGDRPRALVADVGSGVTFFPFAVAQLGCNVICTDTDPVCTHDICRAAEVVPHAAGKVSFRPAAEHRMPFADEELDAAYCVSVLEHVADADWMGTEIARILRKGGLFLVTMDLDLRGDQSIGVKEFYRLVRSLHQNFVRVFPETTVHPRDLLTSASGQYAERPPSVLGTSYGLLRGRCRVRDVASAIRRRPPYHLACGGWVLERR